MITDPDTLRVHQILSSTILLHGKYDLTLIPTNFPPKTLVQFGKGFSHLQEARQSANTAADTLRVFTKIY